MQESCVQNAWKLHSKCRKVAFKMQESCFQNASKLHSKLEKWTPKTAENLKMKNTVKYFYCDRVIFIKSAFTREKRFCIQYIFVAFFYLAASWVQIFCILSESRHGCIFLHLTATCLLLDYNLSAFRLQFFCVLTAIFLHFECSFCILSTALLICSHVSMDFCG